MKTVAALAVAFAAAVNTAWADPNCRCRANGSDYVLGDVVCITNASGSWLGQCSMVLNNTAWKKLGDSCPQTHLAPSKASSALALCVPVQNGLPPASVGGENVIKG